MRIAGPALEALQAQRGHLFPWVPVCLAIGIGGYFLMPSEPGAGELALCAAGVVSCAFLARRKDMPLSPLAIALALVLAGVLLAGVRARMVAAPQLEYRYYGPIEGRIVAIDRSQSDRLRLTLDQVTLGRIPAARTPFRVRISLHGDQSHLVPLSGLRVMMTGHLSPPRGPVEPGGFDFQRMSWFQGLGAVGYTRTPVLALAPPDTRGLWLHGMRMRLSAGLQAALPGDAGAFAAAILTGDRSGMGKPMLEALRAANLAHLLAISGLHMGLLSGLMFAAVRLGLALVPPLALRWPVRKIAAAVALVAGAGYLGLSGGNVATERAFVMVSVMLGAVLLGRRALTLRAVAIAAVIVLMRRPETLTGPGFQMSFAATVALVAAFSALRDWRGWRLPGPLRPLVAVVISSAVAGAATAPFAAAHFNQIAHYGLIANLLSVPVMGLVVMPAAIAVVLLYPFGLAWMGLEVMRLGISWILGVASWVAAAEGALSHVISPPWWVLPVLSLGGLWLVLWRGRARLFGVPVLLGALLLWGSGQRPALLISESGGLVGLMGPEGRALSKPRGEGFSARSWLENDGDPASQKEAARRPGLTRQRGETRFVLAGRRFVQLYGRGAAARLPGVCRGGGWVILSARIEEEPGAVTAAARPGNRVADSAMDAVAGCRVIDRRFLERNGPLAVYPPARAGEELRVVTTHALAGQRLWNTRALQEKVPPWHVLAAWVKQAGG